MNLTQEQRNIIFKTAVPCASSHQVYLLIVSILLSSYKCIQRKWSIYLISSNDDDV